MLAGRLYRRRDEVIHLTSLPSSCQCHPSMKALDVLLQLLLGVSLPRSQAKAKRKEFQQRMKVQLPFRLRTSRLCTMRFHQTVAAEERKAARTRPVVCLRLAGRR